MPQISIIVPVYNVEQYIHACLDSILHQTMQDFELILVDDGSTDRSGDICEQYAVQDPRILVLHQQNQGQSVARNCGLQAAAGTYLSFVDSDDVVHPQLLELLLSGMSDTVDICACEYSTFSDAVPQLHVEEPQLKRKGTGYEACLRVSNDKDFMPSVLWAKLYKRALFSDLLFPAGRIHEDDAKIHEIYYRANQILELSNSLYFYRVTPNSTMTKHFSLKRYDAMKAHEDRCAFFSAAREPELEAAAQRYRQLVMAKLSIQARQAGIYDQVPEQYRISECRALRIIRKESTPERFQWFLSLQHPRLSFYDQYYRQIQKKLFHRK